MSVTETTDTTERPITGSAQQASRQGKKRIAGYFDPVVHKQFKRVSVDEERTCEDLLAEALNLLFHARQLPEIARASTSDHVA